MTPFQQFHSEITELYAQGRDLAGLAVDLEKDLPDLERDVVGHELLSAAIDLASALGQTLHTKNGERLAAYRESWKALSRLTENLECLLECLDQDRGDRCLGTIERALHDSEIFQAQIQAMIRSCVHELKEEELEQLP